MEGFWEKSLLKSWFIFGQMELVYFKECKMKLQCNYNGTMCHSLWVCIAWIISAIWECKHSLTCQQLQGQKTPCNFYTCTLLKELKYIQSVLKISPNYGFGRNYKNIQIHLVQCEDTLDFHVITSTKQILCEYHPFFMKMVVDSPREIRVKTQQTPWKTLCENLTLLASKSILLGGYYVT